MFKTINKRAVIASMIGTAAGVAGLAAVLYFFGRQIPGADAISKGLRGDQKSDGNIFTLGR